MALHSGTGSCSDDAILQAAVWARDFGIRVWSRPKASIGISACNYSASCGEVFYEPDWGGGDSDPTRLGPLSQLGCHENSLLDLPAGATKEQVLAAVQGHTVAQAQLTGTYQR